MTYLYMNLFFPLSYGIVYHQELNALDMPWKTLTVWFGQGPGLHFVPCKTQLKTLQLFKQHIVVVWLYVSFLVCHFFFVIQSNFIFRKKNTNTSADTMYCYEELFLQDLLDNMDTTLRCCPCPIDNSFLTLSSCLFAQGFHSSKPWVSLLKKVITANIIRQQWPLMTKPLTKPRETTHHHHCL